MLVRLARNLNDAARIACELTVFLIKNGFAQLSAPDKDHLLAPIVAVGFLGLLTSSGTSNQFSEFARYGAARPAKLCLDGYGLACPSRARPSGCSASGPGQRNSPPVAPGGPSTACLHANRERALMSLVSRV